MIIKPKPKQSLEEIKEELKEKVNNLRSLQLCKPIYFNNIYFDTDAQSLRNISYWHLQILSGVILPENFTWRDTNNIDHLVDETFIINLSKAITEKGTLIYQKSWQHKANIDAISNYIELKNYDINIGWD